MKDVGTFKIRCSAIARIMAGNMGLSDSQLEKLNGLEARHENPPVIPMTATKASKLEKLLAMDSDETKKMTPKMVKDLAQLEYEQANPKRKGLTENMVKEMILLRQIQANPELPAGAKTYVKHWYQSKFFNRRKLFTSKETAKGNINEDWSIDFMGDMMDEMFLKNDEYFENDYLTGTPDVIRHDLDLVIDVKNSWDAHTFPLLENEPPNIDYVWQLLGYMALTGLNNSKLVYTLSDAPEHLIDQAARREASNLGLPDVTEELYNKHYDQMTFADIPNEMRIKTFDIKRDDAMIEKIYQRVAACNAYLETIKIK